MGLFGNKRSLAFLIMYNTSVLRGDDFQVIDILLDLHAVKDPEILDVTHNLGVMWKKCKYHPRWRMDISEKSAHDIRADFLALPFTAESFDVIVFDPPHLSSHMDSKNSSGIWRDRYGLKKGQEWLDHDSIGGVFSPFLEQAKRVLKPEGIILAKIADTVHNHRYQWQQVEFIVAAMKSGMTPCDQMIKERTGGSMISSKWKTPKHLRKNHCYWIVVRKGGCECRSEKATERKPAHDDFEKQDKKLILF